MIPTGVSTVTGDFGINRIAQRVRCIYSLGYTTSNGEVLHTGPSAGSEYTVTAFLDCRMTKPPAPGIELKEIETPICACCGERLSWPIFAFRPIISDKTEARVAELKAVATKQSAKPEVPVPLEVVERFAESFARSLVAFTAAQFIAERLGLEVKQPQFKMPDMTEIVEAYREAL